MEQVASRQVQLAIEFVARKIDSDGFRYKKDINYGWVILYNDEPFMYLVESFEPDSVGAIVNGLNIAASEYKHGYDAGHQQGLKDAIPLDDD